MPSGALARAGRPRRRRARATRRRRSPRPARPTATTGTQLLREGRRVGNPVEPLVRALVARVGEETAPLRAPRRDEPGRHGHGGDARHPPGARPRARRARPRRRGRARPSPALTGTRRWPAARCCSRPCRRPSGSRRPAGSSPCSTPARGSPQLRRRGARGAARRRRRDARRARRRTGPRSPASTPASSTSPRPTLPWHTNRVRIAELGAALDIAAGVLAKIGLDVLLLAQTEVAEVREGGEGGGSSAMPQKRNAVGAMRARACAELARAHASVLTGALVQEHERAAGAWQAEWEALSGALQYAGRRSRRAGGLAGGARGRRGSDAGEPRPHRRADRRRADRRRPHRAARPHRRAHARAGRLAARRRERAVARRGARRSRHGPDGGGDPGRARADDLPRLGRRSRRSRPRPLRRRARRRRSEAPPRRRRPRRCTGARPLELARDDARDVGAAGGTARGALPGRALRPARPRALARRAGPDDDRRLSAATSSSSSTTLGLERVSFCGLSLGGVEGCGSPSTRRSGSSASRSAARPPSFPPRQGWVDRAATVRAEGMGAIADAVLGRWFRPSFREAHPEVVARFRAMLAVDPGRGVRGLLRSARRRRPQPAARGRSTAPTLVLTGSDDPVVPPAER